MRLRKFGLMTTVAVLAALPVVAQEANAPLGLDRAAMSLLGNVDPAVRKATAIVNGEVITDTDVDQRLQLVLTANQGRVGGEERARLRLQIVRNLIDEKLQIQEAKENDVTINDPEVDQAFARVAQNFRQSPAGFTEYLRQAGSSAVSLKQQIRAELAWSRLLRRRVEPFVNVGDEEVQTVIARLEASKGQDQYRVGEIFLPATSENEAQVTADAARIVQQIRAGASFIAYARQFSEASTAAVGGDLGYVQPEQLAAPLQPVLKTLSQGQVSDPVRVPGGITILALLDKRKVLAADPADAVLSLKQMSLPFKPGTTQAQANEAVKAMQVRTQSMGGCGRAEEAAKAIGADVVANDQVRLGNLPPQLQSILKTMQVGQATPPFGSIEEGIRVLVLCGREDPEQGKGPSFDEVYAQINEERVSRAARRYMRDLRRDAIVDYR